MKKPGLLLSIVLIHFLYPGVQPSYGQCEMLIRADEFNGSELDPEKWNIEVDNSGGGNEELQYYTDRDTNVFVKDGLLTIRALKEEYINRSYTSARINTRHKGDWCYGKYEARIKLPEGQGIWPAFWMLPTDNVYGGWPNSGEIDIMELVGHQPDRVYGTLHAGPPWNFTNGIYVLPSGKFSDDFHVFSLEWSPDTIKWYVDDNLYSLKTQDSVGKPEQWLAFRERFHLILNLAVGGNWPGDPDETTVFPRTMEVDYVRVYGDPDDQEIIAVDRAYANAKGVRYNFTDVPGATFNWSVPEGAQIISGQGTNRITVDWGCNEGNISLELSDIACGDQLYTLPVEFTALELYGKEEACQLEEMLFRTPDLAGTDFTWHYPGDAVLNGTANNDSIHLTWGCGEGYVKVVAENICGTGSDSILVTLKDPGITGPSTVAENATDVQYEVDSMPAMSYQWSVPAGALITGGQGTHSILVDFGTEDGTVRVDLTNSCGTNTLSQNVRITDTIMLLDHESSFLEFETWASTTYEMVDNPLKDDVNPSEHAGKSFKSEVAWSGIYADLGYNLDLEKHQKFCMKVMGPKTGDVLFKLEDHVENDVQPTEVSAPLTQVNAWEELCFIFPGAPTGVFDRLTLFFDFGSGVENFYYFDDIILYPYPVGTFSNVYDSGYGLSIFPNPSKGKMHIRFLAESRNCKLYFYDLHGQLIFSEYLKNRQKGQVASLDISFLPEGMYLLRIDQDGKSYAEKFIVQ